MHWFWEGQPQSLEKAQPAAQFWILGHAHATGNQFGRPGSRQMAKAEHTTVIKEIFLNSHEL